MPENFEDKLMDLIDEQLLLGVGRDEIVSAMELRIMAMDDEDEDPS